MVSPSPQLSAEEVARRGQALFLESIAPLVKDRDEKDYVVIDVDSGDFEIGADSLEVSRALHGRHPGAMNVWGRFVGSEISLRFGYFR